MSDRCEIPGCHHEVDVIYLGKNVCDFHWNQLNADGETPNALRMGLGIEASEPTAITEEAMADKKSDSKSKKAAKATKEPGPKKEKKPKEDLVVFAIRLSKPERDKIHATAGPAGATRFIRAVAAAFANEDEAAFRSVLKEARDIRS